MKETFSDVDKLNTRYGLQALGSATNPLSKGSQIPLLRFRWATQDKHAFERLILDLKDFNDGLHATLVPMVQRNVDFTVCSEVSIAAQHVNDLYTIQQISQDSEMLKTTASFKAFGTELHRNEQHGITPPPSPLEIPGSALRFIENNDSATSDERSQASCRLDQSEFSQSVLVEWKYYEQSAQVRVSLNLSLLRIQRLVQLLGQKPKPKDFRTLDCMGYVHDRIHSRVGLVFNVVPQAQTSRPPSSRDVLLVDKPVRSHRAAKENADPRSPHRTLTRVVEKHDSTAFNRLDAQGIPVEQHPLLFPHHSPNRPSPHLFPAYQRVLQYAG
jgi:hypothetical protein